MNSLVPRAIVGHENADAGGADSGANLGGMPGVTRAPTGGPRSRLKPGRTGCWMGVPQDWERRVVPRASAPLPTRLHHARGRQNGLQLRVRPIGGKLAGQGVGLDVFRPWPVRQHELNSQERAPTTPGANSAALRPAGRSGSGDPARAALRPPARNASTRASISRLPTFKLHSAGGG